MRVTLLDLNVIWLTKGIMGQVNMITGNFTLRNCKPIRLDAGSLDCIAPTN
jgi:hypothetical protein